MAALVTGGKWVEVECNVRPSRAMVAVSRAASDKSDPVRPCNLQNEANHNHLAASGVSMLASSRFQP